MDVRRVPSSFHCTASIGRMVADACGLRPQTMVHRVVAELGGGEEDQLSGSQW